MSTTCYFCNTSLRAIQLMNPNVFVLCCHPEQIVCVNCLCNDYIVQQYINSGDNANFFRCPGCLKYLELSQIQYKRDMFRILAAERQKINDNTYSYTATSRQSTQNKTKSKFETTSYNPNLTRSYTQRSQLMKSTSSQNLKSQYKSQMPSRFGISDSNSTNNLLSTIRKTPAFNRPFKTDATFQKKPMEQENEKVQQIQNQMSNLVLSLEDEPFNYKKFAKQESQFVVPLTKSEYISFPVSSQAHSKKFELNNSQPVFNAYDYNKQLSPVKKFEYNPSFRGNNSSSQDYFLSEGQRRRNQFQQYMQQQYSISQSMKGNQFFNSR